MKKNCLLTGCAICVGIAVAHPRTTLAGWSGQMNGTGLGRATANVSSPIAFGSVSDLKQSLADSSGLSAAVAAANPVAGYDKSAPLPGGASGSTYSLLKGLPGYIWQAATAATGGDKTDNLIIETLIPSIVPQPNAILDLFQAEIVDDPSQTDPIHKLLNITGSATGGTAMMFLGLVWDGDEPPTDEELLNLLQETPSAFAFNIAYVPEIDDPTLPEGRFNETFKITLPEDETNFLFITEGFATSAVPDGGNMIALLGLALGGLAFARKQRALKG